MMGISAEEQEHKHWNGKVLASSPVSVEEDKDKEKAVEEKNCRKGCCGKDNEEVAVHAPLPPVSGNIHIVGFLFPISLTFRCFRAGFMACQPERSSVESCRYVTALSHRFSLLTFACCLSDLIHSGVVTANDRGEGNVTALHWYVVACRLDFGLRIFIASPHSDS